MNAKTLLSVLSLGALLLAAPLQAEPLLPDKPLKVVETSNIIFPKRLMALTNHGEVRVLVSVDSQGVLQDHLVIGYTKKPFADIAESAIKQWKFEPAQVKGSPVSVVSEITISFEATGVVVDLDLQEAVAAMYYWWERAGRFEYHPVALKELDRIPIPKAVVAPLFPHELADKGVCGDVTIAFYIDEQGQVKMPAITDADDMRLAEFAMNALNKWTFEPPTRKGEPVLVRASQTFKFMPEKPAAPKPAAN
jgi:TonB family protein